MVGGGYGKRFVLGEAAAGFLNDGKSLGQDVEQDVFEGFVALFAQFVHLLKQVFFGMEVLCIERLLVDGSNFAVDIGQVFVDARAEIKGFAAQFVVGQLLVFFKIPVDFGHRGLVFAYVALLLGAEYFF